MPLTLFEPAKLRRLGWFWLIAAALALALHLLAELQNGMTDAQGHPFGDDTLNFWSASALAIRGDASQAYDLLAFHRFEMARVGPGLQLYHASYPPMLMLLTAPLGLLPFPLFWAVWLFGGWLLFALSLRPLLPRGWALYAASFPAVFVDAMSGQIGCWIAAVFIWSLRLLPARPVLAGALLALAIVKPQLVWLAPLAFCAARQWRALAGFVGSAVLLLTATDLIFGHPIWLAYARQADLLRQVILEEGTGVWHRMVSVFVLARHLGAGSAMAYTLQAVASAMTACFVWRCWRPGAAPRSREAVLLLGAVFASPYVSDYDLVLLAPVPLWLLDARRPPRTSEIAALTLLVAAPVLAAPLSKLLGIAGAALLLLPALWIAGCGGAAARWIAQAGPWRHARQSGTARSRRGRSAQPGAASASPPARPPG